VRSFDQLSERNVDTLNEIAKLSPGRVFYPANERVMQSTSFSSRVSFLSQHNGMFKAVQSIFRQAENVKLLYPDSVSLRLADGLPRIDVHLLERDAIRSSTFRTTGFGAEDHTVSSDVQYKARDSDQSSDRARYAHDLSTMVYRSLQSRHLDNAVTADLLWTASKTGDCVLGTSKANACVFKFDPRLVASGLDFTQWLAIHQTVKSAARNSTNNFDLMMWLSALAASKDVDLRTLQIIALMCTTQSVRDVAIPMVDTCTPSEGHSVSKSQITAIIRSNLVPIEKSPEGVLRKNAGEDWSTFRARRDRLFSNKQNSAIEVVAGRIWSQWPSNQVSLPDFSDQAVKPSSYINVATVVESARSKFKMCFDNLQLFNYFTQLQSAVSVLPNRAITAPLWSTSSPVVPSPRKRFVSSADILDLTAPILPKNDIAPAAAAYNHNDSLRFPRLSIPIETLQFTCGSAYEADYVQELRESVQCLEHGSAAHILNAEETYTVEYLLGYQASCQGNLTRLYRGIVSHIHQCSEDISGAIVAESLSQWPRISPTFLVRLLNRHYWPTLKEDWKKCVVQYGLAITAVQRADRLLKAAKSTNQEDLVNEIMNVGHSNWIPHQHPESLLLEIESGILIRDVQVDIATEMRDPSTSTNAVMQLNMGEGKSSVIVPMVATSLADTFQLARVIVAKPQSKQMRQMLISKLGGAIDRRVLHMPISRSLKLGKADADSIGTLVRECMSNGDVLLVQPEHILSFQLMVLECFESIDKQEIGQSLLATQFFFDECSRDIVDESDENFSTKFELIYTMGTQRQIEFSPNRWICIQEVLGLIRDMVQVVDQEMPDSVEIRKSNPGGFPRLRILKPEAGERLVALLATHICDAGIGGFPIARQAKYVRDAVLQYLVKFDLSENEIAAVENLGAGSFWDSAIARSSLLLLRGLLAGGILTFVFGQKRWRVNYGLVSNRTPPTQLAVPYRAKDNPTPRSEFSHPDVVLVLTSLSYYYDGLKDEDIFTALKHLMRSDQADVEYGAWIGDAKICLVSSNSLRVSISEIESSAPWISFHISDSGRPLLTTFSQTLSFQRQ
jgi:hypothetical protein